MARSFSVRFRRLLWPLRVGVLLIVACVPPFSLGDEGLATQPRAKPNAIFQGKWDGKYEDNQRQTGEGEYEFHEGMNGRLTVTVSWGKPKKQMKLTGQRLGHDTLRIEGEYDGTSYRYIGGMAGDELKLHYESFDKKTGKLGFGLSRLTRPKTEIKSTNGIYYLELTGSPTQMGMKHGAALKTLIRQQVTEYPKNVIDTFGKENGERILHYVVKESEFVKDIKKHFPHLCEEMAGIAKGADLGFDDILLLQMYEEVFEGAPEALKIKPLKSADGNARL